MMLRLLCLQARIERNIVDHPFDASGTTLSPQDVFVADIFLSDLGILRGA